jgi:hypothetical protein
MQDAGYELPRARTLGRWVNKGKKRKGWNAVAQPSVSLPKGLCSLLWGCPGVPVQRGYALPFVLEAELLITTILTVILRSWSTAKRHEG